MSTINTMFQEALTKRSQILEEKAKEHQNKILEISQAALEEFSKKVEKYPDSTIYKVDLRPCGLPGDGSVTSSEICSFLKDELSGAKGVDLENGVWLRISV